MAGGSFGGGTGEIQNPYLIEDADDFFAIRKAPYAFYKLVSSINLMECSNLGPSGWIPDEFIGTLDGNGYSIENLKNHSQGTDVGLFTVLRGTVRNVQMSNFDILGGTRVGALAGRIEQAKGLAVENCAVVNSVIKGSSYVGSIAGTLYTGDIRNSYSKATVQADNNYKGGLFGSITSDITIEAPTIENCYFAGAISGTGTNGGLVGASTQAPVVINSYFNAGTGNGFGEIKTPEEMLLAATYVGWDIPMANHLQKVWAIADGSLPELFFNAGSRFLVLAEGKYYKLDGEDWVEMGTLLPTEAEFASFGLSEGDLAGVPGFVWNKLRIHRVIEIVNLRERYRVDQVYDHKALVNQGQVTDGFLLKTSIDLSQYGDALGRVYFKH
jgi:hypothetical protein